MPACVLCMSACVVSPIRNVAQLIGCVTCRVIQPAGALLGGFLDTKRHLFHRQCVMCDMPWMPCQLICGTVLLLSGKSLASDVQCSMRLMPGTDL
jgi:hypothetical protein